VDSGLETAHHHSNVFMIEEPSAADELHRTSPSPKDRDAERNSHRQVDKLAMEAMK